MPNLEQYQAMFHSLACGICRVALDEEFTLLYANPFFIIYTATPVRKQTTSDFIQSAIFYRSLSFQKCTLRL